MSDHLGTLSNISGQIALEALEEAASFFVDKLVPNIPKSLLKKEHMKDHVAVEIKDDEVLVSFEDTNFYWRFAENGTVNQRAQHFASGTFEQNKNRIEDIMTKKILDEMRG